LSSADEFAYKAARTGPGILAPGAELTASKSLSSPNGAYRLVMQGDGNLVEYTSANAVVWDSATSGSGAYLVMQGDGNLVLYSGSSAVLWDSATSGTGAYVYLGDDGNLEVEADGATLWEATL
jgi:hypothetical protein